jgi:hypothetical protein
MAEFVREIYELLQDEKSVKYNPLKDCECFALTSKYKKKGKSNKTYICYFVLMILHFWVLVQLIYPRVAQPTLIYLSYLLFAMCLGFNYSLSKGDPGFISSKNDEEFL